MLRLVKNDADYCLSRINYGFSTRENERSNTCFTMIVKSIRLITAVGSSS